MRKSFIVAAALIFGLVAVNASPALAWVAGDIFAAVGGGNVNVYAADGSLTQTLNTGQGGFTTGMAFDAAGNLYVTNFSSASVSRFDATGASLGLWGSGFTANPESIVFNAVGEAYVGHAGGTGDIHKFDAAGNPLAQYNVLTGDRGSDWIDLAADQATMYYTSEDNDILRYDVATSTQLADFSTGTLTGGAAYALRILADGGVLVANSQDIKRLDNTGAVVQTYDVAGQDGWFALNLNPDGTSFWSGDFGNGMLYEFDMASGTMTQSISTGSGALFGVAVFGEVTQGGPDPNPVPEPGTMALLGLGLAGIGTRLRRRK